MEVRRAKKRDLKAVKKLADEHRHELGFVRSASLEEAINERRLLVAVDSSPVPRPESSALSTFAAAKMVTQQSTKSLSLLSGGGEVLTKC